VIKAFNNILATSLLEKGVPTGRAGRIALPVAGDPGDAKATVLRLVDDLGFDPVDAGELDDSWRQQPGTPAYCSRRHGDRRLPGGAAVVSHGPVVARIRGTEAPKRPSRGPA
jgi:predicted dinucleotide-binding enzyme